ncbi:MAG: helicase-related protein, partial [Trebonia sp.]
LNGWPKGAVLLDQLRRRAASGDAGQPEKVLVFTAFRGEADALLSTESAGEGRNLQFCHVMVNMDLPWNPMQIEQRLGRLPRVGQDHDVQLTNLVARGTIEEQVLRVLATRESVDALVGDADD